MGKYGMAEFLGIRVEDVSEGAWRERNTGICPFMAKPCNKKSRICSIKDASEIATAVCPNRFLERGTIHRDAASLIFGRSAEYGVLAQIPFLKSVTGHPAGRIDNVVVRLENGVAVDWFALEIQAVYFSGKEMMSESAAYRETNVATSSASRRPDYRSSSAKRLLPQLDNKVPTLSRWGKKMVVVVDKPFFSSFAPIQEANDLSNAEVCWLVYDFVPGAGIRFQLKLNRSVMATLADTRTGVIAASIPPRADFERALSKKLKQNLGLDSRF